MLVIEKLVNAKEEIMDAQEKIDDLLRRLYGQNRERFIDPNQMDTTQVCQILDLDTSMVR